MIIFLKLFTYMIFSYGLSNLFIYANGPFGIFEHIRNIANRIHEQLGELFSCMMCMSSWIGIFFSLINLIIIPSIAFTPANIIFAGTGLWWLILIIDIGFTSGFVWILHNFEEMMERAFYKDE